MIGSRLRRPLKPARDTTHVHSSSVSGREIARQPPRTQTHQGGGRAVRRKSASAPFSISSVRHCCDSVAMRAVSSRCQLKSLRDERWRRPLSHREIGERAVPTRKEITTPARNGAPVCTCKVLFGDLVVQVAASIRRSISTLRFGKSIGLVNRPAAPRSTALRQVSASP